MNETQKEQELENRFLDQGFPIKIGSTQFFASTLTDKDYADLTGFIRARYLEINEEVSRGHENYKERMALAQGELINVIWSSKVGQDIIWADDGIGLLNLGYIMCRKKQPTLTLKKFKERFDENKIESCRQIAKGYEILNFPLEKDEKDDAGGASSESGKSEI